MEKKWYKVTFYAPMTEKDVQAMNGSFYAAMEEMMNIYGCEGLSVEEDKTQQRLNYDLYDEDEPVELHDDEYTFDEKTGDILISSRKFGELFDNTDYVKFCFVDEDDKPIREYRMYKNDGKYIHCEFMD